MELDEAFLNGNVGQQSDFFFHVLPKCSEKDTVREGGGISAV